MNIIIREMTMKDADAVNKLSKQLGYSLSVAETKQQIAAVLLHDEHISLVAVADEKIVGWIHAFVAITIESKPSVEIGGLIIDENYRGAGVGRKLVERIKEYCKQKSILSLRVRSNVKRIEAHNFYVRIGFSEVKEQKVFALQL